MAKVNKVPEWTYSTQQVDLMLWQYCEGLKDFAPHLPREKVVEIFRKNVADKIVRIKSVFKIDPSFSVDLVIKNEMFDLVKTKP